MRRRVLKSNGVTPGPTGPITDPTLTNSLDVCFYNSTKDRLEYYTREDTLTAIQDSDFRATHTPVGIVVVPGTHNRYGQGNGAAMMSLKYMAGDTPETGNAYGQRMTWGQNHVSITSINPNTYLVITADNTSNTAVGLSNSSLAYIPLQAYANTAVTRDYSPYAPSPFAGSDYMSGAANESYSTPEFDFVVGDSNALKDFNGEGNTSVLLSLATAQPNWMTDSEISPSSGSGYSPAACCCARYDTVGTNAGDWYLPAVGELGYLIPRFGDAKYLIDEIAIAYAPADFIELDKDVHLYTSSIIDYSDDVYGINLAYGEVGMDSRAGSSQYTLGALAFCRLRSETTRPIGYYANTLDVLFAKSDGSMIIEPEESWPDASTGYVPIGIVVIPGSHNVYGNSTCGVMSLAEMTNSNPETGTVTTRNALPWGYTGYNFGTHYNRIITTTSSSNTLDNGLSNGGIAYIPVQTSSGGTPEKNNGPYAPSPYIGSDYKSGGFNALYGTTSHDSSTNKNALGDFDGVGNTKLIVDTSNSVSESWKTGTISVLDRYGFYPSAQCCARYYTTGTKRFIDCSPYEISKGTGFWYFPSAGEFGYTIPLFADINRVITALNNKYGSGNTRPAISLYKGSSDPLMSTDNSYWTSSPGENGDNNDANSVNFRDGKVGCYGANNNQCYVRAFIRV